MGLLGDDVAAATFTSREEADDAWGVLADEGIPATVLTDPGILGAYKVSVMVSRSDLERAQAAIAKTIGDDEHR